ncbi:hypothetical protein [Azospirillum halopraeferens]|uniref:hypothetical protein n=1 Tax=Azospirillum halopraeferens TaxID=34010 RepID=UPI00042492C4|nr:hypothetical protein [Azospirillum halopraeferens]
MFDHDELGRITPDEQADALRTLTAVFATSVARPGVEPRNAISAEILDIVDEVPADRAEAVAQLFSMMALRLRRRAGGRGTVFRQTVETALLARSHTGAPPPDGEAAYLAADLPDLVAIDAACAGQMERLAGKPAGERRAALTAEVLAAALTEAERERRLGGPDRSAGDLAVVEFLLRAAAQYLAATGGRRG